MAENDGQEKTEEATAHRKEQAVERGDIVHSREVVTASIVLLLVLALPVLAPLLMSGFRKVFVEFLSFNELAVVDIASLKVVSARVLWLMAPMLLPMLGLVVAVGIAANVAQVGWVVSSKKLEPKFERLSPAKNISRLIGRKAAAEAVRTVLKLLIVAGMAAIVIRRELPNIMGLQQVTPVSLLALIGGFLWEIAWRVTLLMVAFAAVDYGYQRWDWARRLRMSRQELREEIKEREGNPLIKQRIRQIQNEQARKRMMAAVPTATAVITNPTHCAVALRYVPGESAAPVVVAKGIDHLAQRIRAVAKEHNVPCVEDKPVAWSLYRGVKIGREVPAHLYKAVAEILAYVFRLRGMSASRGEGRGSKVGKPKRRAIRKG